MAGNDSIRLLRGTADKLDSTTHKDKILPDGQPLYDKTNNWLCIGDDGTISARRSISVNFDQDALSDSEVKSIWGNTNGNDSFNDSSNNNNQGNTTQTFTSIKDFGKDSVPYIDINFGKPNEYRKRFLEKSLLIGDTHYSSKGIGDSSGNWWSFPSQSGQLVVQHDLDYVYNRATDSLQRVNNPNCNYINIPGDTQYKIHRKGMYIIFSTNNGLQLRKSDNSTVLSKINQLVIMTCPYVGNPNGEAFVAMGLSIGDNMFTAKGVQLELNDGSYVINADSGSLSICEIAMKSL